MDYIGNKHKYTFDELVAARSRLIAASIEDGVKTKARVGQALLTGRELKTVSSICLDKWYVITKYDGYGFYIRNEDGDQIYCLIQDCAVLGGDACDYGSTEVYWEVEYA